MKTELLAQTTDDASASTDTSSEYSVIGAESPDIENIEKLREKIKNQDIIIRDFEAKLTDAENNIVNQNEKISLYEATIKDKNYLINSLNNSIELLKENKELAIKQLKDQIDGLQSAPCLSQNLTSNKDDAKATEAAEFEKKPTEMADLQTPQKQFAESQSQNETSKDIICQLKSANFDLKSKLDENIQQMAILEQKSNTEKHKLTAKIEELEKEAKILEKKSITEENKLRAKINELEKEAKILEKKSNTEERKLRAEIEELEKKLKIYEANSKEDDVKLDKCALNTKSCQSKNAPFVFLNHSKMTNINFIKIGDQDTAVIVENGWTVFLRRFDGSVDFWHYFNNTSYSRFGDLRGEFWLGIETIHKLTSSTRHELYIELVDFDDVTAYARYDNFVVGSGAEDYAIKSLGAYSGNAGDALRSHENAKLSCVSTNNQFFYWWFSENNQCCLTGEYKKSGEPCWSSDMYWGNWNLGQRYPLKACKMLIRKR